MVYQLESSQSRSFLSNEANWTATYRRDSTIVTPYGRWERGEGVAVEEGSEDWASGREGRVAWLVSNCKANNKRLEYGQALAKHFPVDIIGKCGPQIVKCSRVRIETSEQLVIMKLYCRENQRSAGGLWRENINFTSHLKTVIVSTTFRKSFGML